MNKSLEGTGFIIRSYKCEDCEDLIEVREGEVVERCPRCGSENLYVGLERTTEH